MSAIEAGAIVVVRDVRGTWLRRRAMTGVQDGHDFRVVWVCREEEWEAAHAEGRKPEGVPWPAEDVQLAEEGPEQVAV